jgi:arsenate reductase
MSEKIKVLFVCVHNGGRSQIAEAFLNNMAGERFVAESAGLEPGVMNRLVIKSMKDVGIDISKNKTKSINEFIGKYYDYVITVCDDSSGEKFPVFPGNSKRLHWTFEDPSLLNGSEEENIIKIAEIRDEIKEKIRNFINEFGVY